MQTDSELTNLIHSSFSTGLKNYVVEINYPRTQTHFFVVVVFKNRHSFILTDVWSVISQTAWWVCGWSNMIGDTSQTHNHMMKELCQCPVLRCYQIYQELDFKVRTLTSHPSETPLFFKFNKYLLRMTKCSNINVENHLFHPRNAVSLGSTRFFQGADTTCLQWDFFSFSSS